MCVCTLDTIVHIYHCDIVEGGEQQCLSDFYTIAAIAHLKLTLNKLWVCV